MRDSMSSESQSIRSRERIALDHMNAAHDYERSTNWLEAADEYRKVLSLESRDWGTNYEANVFLAYALIQAGEAEKAIAYCHDAMAIRDRHPLAYATLGLAMQAQSRWNEAARCFIESTRRNPALAYAWPHLEHLLQARPNLLKDDPELERLVDEAREWQEKLFSESPGSKPSPSYLFFPLMEISDNH